MPDAITSFQAFQVYISKSMIYWSVLFVPNVLFGCAVGGLSEEIYLRRDLWDRHVIDSLLLDFSEQDARSKLNNKLKL